MPEDKIKREIEEILNRLDEFVPEERSATRPRRASPEAASALRGAIEALGRVSLRHVMLAALALVLVAYIAMRVNPVLGTWAIVAGLILFATSFVLSLFGRGAKTEKRWRGQVMELEGPSLSERLRAWWHAKKRSR